MSRRGAGLALLLLAAVTVGCAPPPSGGDAVGPATAVVTSSRTASPAPQWNETLARALAEDLERGAAWTVVTADGRPSVQPPVPLSAAADNPLERRRATAGLRAEIEGRLHDAVADDPEVDLLAALDLAARSVAGHPSPRIVVLDSGLSTAGVLRFQDRGGALLGADPGAVAARLADDGALPDLRGVDVLWVGLGDVVAPQEPLGIPERAALVGLWRSVLERAGARVTVVPTPVGGAAVAGGPAVSVVPVAAPSPATGPVALTDAVLGFLPDLPVLRDPAQAAAVLAPWVDRLRGGGVRVVVTGTTSSAGDEAGRLALSRERAAVVAGLLRDAAVLGSVIEVRGVGDRFASFVPDRDAAGRLDPVRAAANRSVVLELVPLP